MAKAPRGKDTLTTRINLDGVEEVKKDFEEIGKAGEKAFDDLSKAGAKADPLAGITKSQTGVNAAFDRLRTSATSTFGTLRTQIAGLADPFNRLKAGLALQESLGRTKAAFGNLRTSLSSFGPAFKSINTGVADITRGAQNAAKAFGVLSLAVGGVAAVTTKLATGAADTAEAIQEQADAFGLSFEQAQNLRNALIEVGGDEKLFERGLTKFAQNSAKAAEDVNKAQQAIMDLNAEWSKATGAAKDDAEKTKINAKYKEQLAKATKEMTKAQQEATDATAGGYQGLVDYANQLVRSGTKQEQFAQVVADFGPRGATKMLAFLTSIATGTDAATASALKMIPALDAVGQVNLAALDQSGDRLGTNFRNLALLVGSELAPAFTALFDTMREVVGEFGPIIADAIGQAAQAVATQITGNKDAIKQFAAEATRIVVELARDLVSALNGIDSEGTSNTIIRLKDNIVSAFNAIKFVVQDILVPAFDALSAALTPVAGLFNGIFGTDLSGKGLAFAAVVMQLTGTMGLLTGAVRLAVAPIRLFFNLLFNGKAIILSTLALIREMYTVVLRLAPVILGFVAANPALLAVAATIGLIAAGTYLLVTRETEAEKAARLHDESLQALNDAYAGVEAGVAGAKEAWEAEKKAQLDAAQAGIDAADVRIQTLRDELQAMKEARQSVANTLGEGFASFMDKWGDVSIAFTNEQLAEAERGRAAWAKNVTDLKARINELQNPNKKLASDTSAVGAAMGKAAGAAAALDKNIAKIKIYGPGGLIKEQDVPTQAFLDAQAAAKKFNDELAKPPVPGGSPILNDAVARNDEFVAKAQKAATDYQAALDQMIADSNAFKDVAAAAFDAIGLGSETMAGRVKAALGTLQTDIAAMATGITDAILKMNTALSQLGQGGGAAGLGGGSPAGPGAAGNTQGANPAAQVVNDWLTAAQQVEDALTSMAATINAQWVAIGDSFGIAVGALPEKAQTAASGVVAALSEAMTLSQVAWSNAISSMNGLQDGLAAGWQSTMNEIVGATADMASQVRSLISGLREQLAALRAAIAAAQAAASRSSRSAEGKAEGGPIYGRGGPTEDNIPIWASAGEFMIRAAAVRRLPLAFLHAINSGRFDLASLMKRFARGYASGGLVGFSAPTMMPSLAGAGPTSSLTLVLDGQRYGDLTGPADTLASLARASKLRKIRSTGRQNPYS